MADPRFYTAAGPFTLNELAAVSGASIGEGANSEVRFIDVQPLFLAGPDHVSFLDNQRYVESFTKSGAGACLVHPDHASKAPKDMALLLTEEPYQAYARVAGSFYPPAALVNFAERSSPIDETAKLEEGTTVAPGVVIGPGAEPQHIEPRLLPYARKAVDAVAEMLD